MRKLMNQLLQDETGAIISAEMVIIATVVVLALVVGWNAVAGAMVGELVDVATAFGSLNQSYNYRGIAHVGHASCSGSGFFDLCSNIVLDTDNQTTVGGGGRTSGGSFGGGGSFASGSATASVSASAAAEQPAAFIDTYTVEGAEEVAVLEEMAVLVEEETVQAQAVEKVDECEVLRKKVEELCLELHRIKTAEAASTTTVTKTLKAVPDKAVPVKPQRKVK